MFDDWYRSFVTATTLTENGQPAVRFTGWRAVVDTTCLTRYTTCDEADVTVVADDARHGPDMCDDACHDGGSAVNLLCASTPDAELGVMLDAAQALLAEQGFRINSAWIDRRDGTYASELVPVILDPDCAAYDAEAAAGLAEIAGIRVAT